MAVSENPCQRHLGQVLSTPSRNHLPNPPRQFFRRHGAHERPHVREGLGGVPVVVGVGIHVQGREHHQLRPALDDALGRTVESLVPAALVQVRHKHHHGPEREVDEPLAVA